MANVGRTALPLVAAVAALVVMAWFDTTVVRDAHQQAGQTFDSSQYTLVVSLGTVASAGAVLLLASLAWSSRSAVVGILYAAVGAYFAFQLSVALYLTGQVNGSPSVLPEPLSTIVTNLTFATLGPLNAVGIVGGGMLIAGVAVLTRSATSRTRSVRSQVTDEPVEPLGAQEATPR